MNNKKANQAIKRYLKGKSSRKETELLESWYIKTAQEADDLPGKPDYFAIEDEILNKLHRRQSRTYHTLWQRIAVAAAILILIGWTVYFYKPLTQDVKLKNDKSLHAQQIHPGGNKAYLTLADGERIALTDIANGQLAEQSGIKITKTTDGQLVYTSVAPKSGVNSSLSNTIETPAGGQYQLYLPDGTKVWLNASTSLKYPVSFAGLKERRVELDGEAYFEAAHNKNAPFRVITNKQEIEVLGTHFNVNCYRDELTAKTSLLEGSVKVLTRANTRTDLLEPGQQAVLSGDKVKISNADVEQAIAWKKGDFVFNGEDLQTVMRQIARWYDVEVVYQTDIPNNTGFVSTMSRKKKITEILKAIEMNQGVNFKIEGRRIIVMP